MTQALRDDTYELRQRLSDPDTLARSLGLERGMQRISAGRVLVRCPAHQDSTASCSILYRQEDQTVSVNCFGCDLSGNVFHLIAAVRRLDIQRDFPRVLDEARRLAGMAPRSAPVPREQPRPQLRVVGPTPEERAQSPWLREFRMRPTEQPRDYRIPYLALAAPTSTLALPAGYVLLPGFAEAEANLAAHGLALERLRTPAAVSAERFAIGKLDIAPRLFQGHAIVSLTGAWESTQVELPSGALWVDLRQPLARLIPTLLEPASSDSLAAWGFFNRALVRQWSPEPGIYPVLRLAQRPPSVLTTVTR